MGVFVDASWPVLSPEPGQPLGPRRLATGKQRAADTERGGAAVNHGVLCIEAVMQKHRCKAVMTHTL